jgi:hypothetical protein
VREEFDLSASDNLMTPSLPSLFAVLSENQMKQQNLPLRLRDVRDVLDLIASDKLIAPSAPMLFSAVSENEMAIEIRYGRD